ncbi:hypothetical protein [Mycolicibacterium nivoides]|uniref:Uncharacterized protein n=1 Tax=Mycolicibacterium nivoides TaxID=2487344 RepID=A0ABW9LKX8_9MYCO
MAGKWLEAMGGGLRPAAANERSERQQWWDYARGAAAGLLEGKAPPPVQVYGPVLNRRETAYFSATANYARLWGGDGTYTTTGLLALGNPAFMVGAFAASGYINHRRKAAARRDAQVRWREQQRVGLIATSHRLLVNTAERGWLTFTYGAVTEYYPDIQNGALTLGFGEQCVPLLLSGPPAVPACVLVSAAVAPDTWDQDPRLAPLLA